MPGRCYGKWLKMNGIQGLTLVGGSRMATLRRHCRPSARIWAGSRDGIDSRHGLPPATFFNVIEPLSNEIETALQVNRAVYCSDLRGRSCPLPRSSSSASMPGTWCRPRCSENARHCPVPMRSCNTRSARGVGSGQ